MTSERVPSHNAHKRDELSTPRLAGQPPGTREGGIRNHRRVHFYVPVVSPQAERCVMEQKVRLRPYLSHDELLGYLHSGGAQPASVQRRLRSGRLLTAGTRFRPRRSNGCVDGETRLYSVLNVLAAALAQIGRDEEAAAVADCAARFEQQFANWLTPTGDVLGHARRVLSDALEDTWSNCRPADVTELRGVVTTVDELVHVRTSDLSELLIPQTNAPWGPRVGDGVVVIQLKTGATGTWLSRLLPAEAVAEDVTARDQHDDETESDLLFGTNHIDYVTRSSPSRERAFDQLARTANAQEPSRLTLLA